MDNRKQSFVLLLQCKDRPGIVARLSDFIFKREGNIIDADQHTTDPELGYFFMRIEFTIDRNRWDCNKLSREFGLVADEFSAEFKVCDLQEQLRMGVLVSKPGHCLLELLYLWKAGELDVKIPFVISNFEEHRSLVESYGLPFYFIPSTKLERKEQEILGIAKKDSDFLVLARYMIILSPQFLKEYDRDIINIHHGFLPSFKGPGPYRQAFEEGVKVIGATAHFVNESLDGGPIISQQVEHVTHRDDVPSLLRKGKNIEKRALVESVYNYIDRRVIKHGNKTIVFENA
jgi:formyltetrahydrofolate deformylase